MQKEGGFLKLTISNFGDKLSEEETQKIFHNFYRINKLGGHEYKGSGLGLAIVKKIADLHSGSVNFISEKGINSVILKI